MKGSFIDKWQYVQSFNVYFSSITGVAKKWRGKKLIERRFPLKARAITLRWSEGRGTELRSRGQNLSTWHLSSKRGNLLSSYRIPSILKPPVFFLLKASLLYTFFFLFGAFQFAFVRFSVQIYFFFFNLKFGNTPKFLH